MKRYRLPIFVLLVAAALIASRRHKGEAGVGARGPDDPVVGSTGASDDEETGDFQDKSDSVPSGRVKYASASNVERRGRRELPGVAIRKVPDLGSDVTNDFGVTIDGAIMAGETLVMGGNVGRDGGHELTFVTPTTFRLDDGREGVRLEMRVIQGGTRFVDESGLRSLSANAISGIQVAEGWTGDRLQQFLEGLDQFDGVTVVTGPSVIAVAGEPFSLRRDGADGSSYSIRGIISPNHEGGFAIRSDLQRTLTSVPHD